MSEPAARTPAWARLLDRLASAHSASIDLGAQFVGQTGLYLVGGVMLVALQLFMAWRDFLVKDAVDAIAAGAGSIAARAAVVILVVSVGAMAVRIASRVTIFTAGRNVEYELRRRLLAHLHRLGPSFFGTMPTGEIMSRATNDLQQVRLLLGFGILNVISSLMALVSALWVMLAISGRLTLAAVSTFPLLALVTRSFSTKMFTRTRENQAALGVMSDRVLASLAGVRVVRSFAMEEAESEAFERENQRYLGASLALARVRGAMGPIMGMVSAAGVLIVFWYGGSLLIEGAITTGDFVAFWLALLRLTWPLTALGFVAAIVQRGRAGYQRLLAVLEAEPEVKDGPTAAPARIDGALRVEGLSFAYGARQVLEDVSFEVPAGGSLAIVGRTGSGKTTLASLLSRLLPTPHGAVFLDGHDVCDLPVATVRAAIGYAQQDAFLFSTTVSENIGFALEDPDDQAEVIREAAREAQVLDDVERLPDGFETVVGERGVQLSGGQKQRVALARALVREPPVLVLDDPLSAVDAKTEAAILETLERQAAERTLILITHRVAAARRCDHIVVLEQGHVVERGTHDELASASGLYALFAEEQQMEHEMAALGERPSEVEGGAA
jgi:ATP-binding cassette subfamily B protein